MSIEFTIEIIEQKKDHLFVTGIALSDIASGTIFSQLYQIGNNKKSRKKIETIELKVESIIAEGEPINAVSANNVAMLMLSGDYDVIQSQAEALRWRKKSGRYIRTSDTALTLADE